jgi:Integrase zinc binding domain
VEGIKGRYRWLTIPPVRERLDIIRDTHDSMGHIGRDKQLKDMGNIWYWYDMRADIMKVIRSCPAC